MKPPHRQFIRRALIGLPVLLLAAWLVPPFFSAERYRRRLEAGLQRVLKRPVEFRRVSFRVLWRPGLTIEDAVVLEDAAFGSEPFARADSINCALRWRSLLLSRIDCAHLSLEHPTLNVVRNERGEWNVESLLQKSSAGSPGARAGVARRVSGLDLDASDGRINFKVREDKKPFAITDVKGRLYFDPAAGLVRYDLTGRPIRTDLSLPTPGAFPTPGILDLAGEWTPGRNLEGPLEARLRTGKSTLYDWIPLLTGRNPEIYGVLEATASITGSLADLKIEGDCQISQLHRWELPPPSDSMPIRLRYRGEFNRRSRGARIEELSGSFADSSFRLAGSVENLSASPQLDLVLAVDESRLEDVLGLGRRFWGDSASLAMSGRVGGLLTVRGPWTARRYSGFFTARDARVSTAQLTFPVPEATLRIDSHGVKLSPVRIALAPRVEAVLEGAVYPAARPRATPAAHLPRRRAARPLRRTRRNQWKEHALQAAAAPPQTDDRFPSYEVSLSAREVPLRNLLRLARTKGRRVLQEIEIEQGTSSGTVRMTGRAWPPEHPQLEGHFEVEAARLLLPGMNQPLSIQRAQVEVNDGRILAAPLSGQIGDSFFSGRFEHEGDSRQPWRFDLRAGRLSLEQASQWFEALGRPAPTSLLDRIPGLSSFRTRRAAALNLFRTLNAQGDLAARAVTYRALALADFRASVGIAGRKVRISGATFRSGGGPGEGQLTVDMSSYPAHIQGEVSVDRVNLQAFADRLSSPLNGFRGLVSGSAQFETSGLSHREMSVNLQGRGILRLRDVSFGYFDPLDALAREAHYGRLEPSHRPASLRSATWSLLVRDQRVFLVQAPLEIAGARLQLSGSYGFDGTLDLGAHCDFSHMARRWQRNANFGLLMGSGSGGAPAGSMAIQQNGEGANSSFSPAELHWIGPLDKLTAVPALQVSHSTR